MIKETGSILLHKNKISSVNLCVCLSLSLFFVDNDNYLTNFYSYSMGGGESLQNELLDQTSALFYFLRIRSGV